MTPTDELKVLFPLLLGSLPTILACIVAMIIVSTRSPRLVGAALWALLGFGLVMVLSVAAPFSQILLQGYFINHGMSMVNHGWAFGVLDVFNSALDAAALVFLLVAVCAGRAPRAVPPPLPPA